MCAQYISRVYVVVFSLLRGYATRGVEGGGRREFINQRSKSTMQPSLVAMVDLTISCCRAMVSDDITTSCHGGC